MSHSNLPASLQLNRQLQNHAFESWKIGSNFVAGKHECMLPGPVYQGASEAVDFVHTRASLLCNHLVLSQGRLFVVATKAATSVCLCEVDAASLEQQAGPVISEVADIPVATAADPAVAPTDAALHASVAVLATPLGAAHLQNTDVTPSATASGVSAAFQALVSTGKGELVLVTHTPGQPAGVSAPIHPLRAPAPALGCKPFSISAAWINPAGLIRTVLSCLTDTSADASSSSSRSSAGAGLQQQRHPGQSAWVCETWLVTLSAHHQQQHHHQQHHQQQQLQVLDCQLLLVSQAPPAAAVACAAADKLLLVSEPSLEDSQLSPGYRHLLAAAMGWSQQQSSTPMDTDTRAAAATAAGGAGNPAGGSAGGMMGADDDDVDPRTLAAAAARLAKYTSEAEVGDLPPQQWSDVFKETGPGELGAGGSEPAADILLYGPADAPSSSTTSSSPPSAAAVAAAGTDAAGRFKLHSTVSCGPHRLLTAENLSVALPGGSVQDVGVMLGVTDDVDCAVVTAAFSNQAAAAAAAAAGSASSSGSSGVLTLAHEAFLPALAYVAAGKTQKRHLLLAQGGSSPVCCALVEGFKYTYLYGQVAQGATYGEQQIVDMELPHGQSILGARLVSVNSSSSSSSSDSGGNAAGTTAVLLLLTQLHLLCYQLKAHA